MGSLRSVTFAAVISFCSATFGSKEDNVANLRGSSTSSGGSCRYHVYVYDLPEKWFDLPKATNEILKGKALERAFGEKVVGMDSVYTTSPLAIGEIIYYRLANSHCRTTDPKKADAFFVPMFPKAKRFKDWKAVCDNLKPEDLDRFEKALVHMTDDNKERHFIVYSQGAHHTNKLPECVAWANSEVLDGMTKLTVDDHDWPYAAWFHPIPYPSMVHCDETTNKCPWQAVTGDRPIQVSMITAEYHHEGLVFDANDGSRLDGITRKDLLDWCQKKPDKICTAMVINTTAAVKDLVDEDLHAVTKKMAELMKKSTYCLQPPTEYSYSKRGIFDSILLGCIPVIFSQKQLRLMPWHWSMPKSNKMAMLMSSYKWKWQMGELINFKRYKKEISAFQKMIAENGHLLQYAPHGSARADADALSVILDHVTSISDT